MTNVHKYTLAMLLCLQCVCNGNAILQNV
jgi:hypothetical protein